MLVSRLFSTHDDAAAAVDDLKKVGFRDIAIRVIDKAEADLEDASLLQHGVSEARAKQYAEGVNRGGTLVLVDAPVGTAATAKHILETTRPGDTGEATAEYEAVTRSAPDRMPKDPATPLSSWMNWRVLLDEPAPLSKWLNWPLLSKPPTEKATSHGLPFLSRNPTPLSSKLGMKVLSDNPTPLSSKLGKGTLSDEAAPFSAWLGKRVLLDNPTPLSTWLNWAVLWGDKRPRP